MPICQFPSDGLPPPKMNGMLFVSETSPRQFLTVNALSPVAMNAPDLHELPLVVPLLIDSIVFAVARATRVLDPKRCPLIDGRDSSLMTGTLTLSRIGLRSATLHTSLMAKGCA